jgi:hypothetical protein
LSGHEPRPPLPYRARLPDCSARPLTRKAPQTTLLSRGSLTVRLVRFPRAWCSLDLLDLILRDRFFVPMDAGALPGWNDNMAVLDRQGLRENCVCPIDVFEPMSGRGGEVLGLL